LFDEAATSGCRLLLFPGPFFARLQPCRAAASVTALAAKRRFDLMQAERGVAWTLARF
jgi:hypothetical protein